MHLSMINALRNLEREIDVVNLTKGTYKIYEKPVTVVVQSLSCVQLCDPMDCGMPTPCPSFSPEVCSDSCPLSWWCSLTISSSATPFSFWLQSFPASGSSPMSQLFPSGGQSTGASASASVLPMSTQGWFPLGLVGIFNTYLMLYWRFLYPQIGNKAKMYDLSTSFQNCSGGHSQCMKNEIEINSMCIRTGEIKLYLFVYEENKLSIKFLKSYIKRI